MTERFLILQEKEGLDVFIDKSIRPFVSSENNSVKTVRRQFIIIS